MKTEIEIIPHGEISSRLKHNAAAHRPGEMGKFGVGKKQIFISYANDLNEAFAKTFSKKSETARLIVINRGASADKLVSQIVDLRIRTPDRFCVVNATGPTNKMKENKFILSLVGRLSSESVEGDQRILDASLQQGSFHVVSLDFKRLDVPLSKMRALNGAQQSEVEGFEIDEDGAFIYWPDLDVHYGWRQLQQIVDPMAAVQALHKTGEFNIRYGKAVKKAREAAGLNRSEIRGLSEKQIGRIENGECRLTANAVEVFASAHGVTPNEFLAKVSKYLD